MTEGGPLLWRVFLLPQAVPVYRGGDPWLQISFAVHSSSAPKAKCQCDSNPCLCCCLQTAVPMTVRTQSHTHRGFRRSDASAPQRAATSFSS